MKTTRGNCKTLMLTGLLLALVTGGAGAQSFSESKTIRKVFPVKASTSVEVINKYGKIHVVSWKKDSVSIHIELKVRSDNMDKLNKIMANIDFDFTGTDYYIIAETVFGKKYNTLFENIKNLAESFIPTENYVEINYTVQVPQHIELKIRQKFGDVFLDNHAGPLRLTLSNGDVKANEITGDATISVEIGNGTINYIRNGKLDIAYSEFEIKKAGRLNIYCRSSRIDIGALSDLSLNSRRDKVYLDEGAVITGETYFSDLWVYDLSKELNLSMKYGSLNMEHIRKDFSFLNINSSYTDLNLTFENASSYLVDINRTNANLRYPTDLGVMEEKVINKDNNVFNTYGKIGKSDTSSKVRITADKGNIKLFHK